MDPKRPGDSSSAARATTAVATAKKKSASRVKVVASRYAQVLQSKNVESHASSCVISDGSADNAFLCAS
ncbi:hypothetical protein Gpo141_00006639 [Globisporangium polare]